MRWPFEKKYDVFVVDYKVVIKWNLLYTKASAGISLFIVSCFILLFVFLWTDFPLYGDILAVVTALFISACIISYIKAGNIIEIDSAAKTIRVRDEYDVMRKDVLCIKISHERDSGGYMANYLTLISEVMGQLRRYHVMTVDYHFDYAHETFEIAGLIAEKLDLELIIEHPEVFSFRTMFKAEEKPPGKVYR